MKPRLIQVNDVMQRGYVDELTEPMGHCSHPDFRPELTPRRMPLPNRIMRRRVGSTLHLVLCQDILDIPGTMQYAVYPHAISDGGVIDEVVFESLHSPVSHLG